MIRILDMGDLPFNQKVTAGFFPGMSVVDKFGLNPTITTATDPEDVWEGGGIYPFSTTADIISLSSDNAGDTEPILIVGLNTNGLEVEQTKTLTGQTRVALDPPLLRVSRMENEGGTDLLGTAYCYSGTTNTTGTPSGGSVEKARIVNGNNQSQMAIFTIPKDKVGFLYRGEIGMQFSAPVGAGTQFAICAYRSRRPNGVFKIKKTITLVNQATSIFQDMRSFPDVIPGLTDIKIEVEQVSEDMGIWATFDILLVDKDKFSAGYLTAIGQPI